MPAVKSPRRKATPLNPPDPSQVRTIHTLFCNGAVALTTAPGDLELGDGDRELTPAEAEQLHVLLWLTPTQAVLLAQQLFDTATPALSVEQIEHIRMMLPAPATT